MKTHTASLTVPKNKLKEKAYSSPAEFDKDIFRLFEKARKWHEEGTYPYGRVLVLQVWLTSLPCLNTFSSL
jgi:chromatin structure-remodeling complex subunit RSC1/2